MIAGAPNARNYVNDFWSAAVSRLIIIIHRSGAVNPSLLSADEYSFIYASIFRCLKFGFLFSFRLSHRLVALEIARVLLMQQKKKRRLHRRT